jgi:sugar-specific transcriptional regulator TrmB
MEVGFTENEAKVYVALLTENPLTAYESAKRAAVPTSKVYEVIARLLERGAVFEVDASEKKRYIPLPPDELIVSHRTRVETTLDELREGLNNIALSKDLTFIRTIHDYGYLIDKAKRIVESATATLLVSICPREMELLRPALSAAENRGVSIAIVHFGQLAKSDGTTEGIHSMSEGFVAMAEDFISHDIYILKIVRRFDKALLNEYGKNYSKLRDIFKDEGL